MIEAPVTFNSKTINDKAGTRYLESSPFYYIDLRAVDGLFGADVFYEEHPIPGKTGSYSGDVYRRGKTVTLSGMIWARHFTAYRVACRVLGEMFAINSRDQLKFTLMGEVQVYLRCRVVQDLSITDSKDNLVPGNVLRGAWVVALRADNPRTYKVSDNTLFPSWQV